MTHQVIAGTNWKQDYLRENSLAEVVRGTLQHHITCNASRTKVLAARLCLSLLPRLEKTVHESTISADLKEHLIGDPNNPLYGCIDLTYYRWPDFDTYDDLPTGDIFLAHIRYWEMVRNEVFYVQAVVKKSNHRLDRENCGSLMDDSHLFTRQNSSNPKADAARYAVEKRKIIDRNFFGEE